MPFPEPLLTYHQQVIPWYSFQSKVNLNTQDIIRQVVFEMHTSEITAAPPWGHCKSGMKINRYSGPQRNTLWN